MFCGLGLQNCYYDTQFTEQQSQLLAKTFFFLLKKKKNGPVLRPSGLSLRD